MRGWVRKIPASANRLQLVADEEDTITTVTEWSREDLEAADEPSDTVKAVLKACQVFTDDAGEEVKFLLRWMTKKDKVLGTKTHKCQPTPAGADDDQEPDATPAAALLRSNMELMKHLGKREEISTDTIREMGKAYREVIELLTEQLKEAHKLLRKVSTDELAPAVAAEWTDEQRRESDARATALKAFTDQLPKVVDVATNAIAMKFLPASLKGELKVVE